MGILRPARRPRFTLKLLGQPLVKRIDSQGGERELAWSLRRALQSVAFLALAPDRRATKDELIEAVWHEVLESSISKNFHPTPQRGPAAPWVYATFSSIDRALFPQSGARLVDRL